MVMVLAKVQLTANGHICGLVCICNLMKQNSKEDMLEEPCTWVKTWVIAPLSCGIRHNVKDEEGILEKCRKEEFEGVGVNVAWSAGSNSSGSFKLCEVIETAASESC